nr:DUF935 family protein [Pseudomonas aeruginosa]
MAQIVDVYGNPIRPQQLREPQTSRLAGLAKEFAQHPAKGLTPAKLARILVEAEQGQPPSPGRIVHGHGGTRRPPVRRNEQAKARNPWPGLGGRTPA